MSEPFPVTSILAFICALSAFGGAIRDHLNYENDAAVFGWIMTTTFVILAISCWHW